MSDDKQGEIHSASDGGVIGKHPAPDSSPLLVAPSTSSEFNTARLRLIPIACFSIDDVRFKFDSSFVLPEVKAEMNAFSALRRNDPKVMGAPISIFGHADPSFQGNFALGSSTAQSGDDYNKTLSGRRAIAIYGLLIRDPSFWETLFSNHLGGDVWGEDSIRIMLDATDRATVPAAPQADPQTAPTQLFGSSATNPPNTGAADSLRNAKIRDITHDSSQRKQLFLQYMDLLCGDLKLDKGKDFLARGAGPDQKGDVQGCSRFNPLRLFSAEDEARFQQAFRDKDISTLRGQRDIENAVNRRVLLLIFRLGSQILPAKWPCPTYKSGAADCQKRFFSDGDRRRSTHSSGRDRLFDQTHDTYACRFYQRLTSGSPCERNLLSFEVRLYDLVGLFIASAPFEFSLGGRTPVQGTADAQGLLRFSDLEVPNQLIIKWGFPPQPGKNPDLVFELDMFLSADQAAKNDEAIQKLHNLGYPDDNNLPTNVAAFQSDYGALASPPLSKTGALDDSTLDLIRKVYRSCEDDLRKDEPS